MSKENRIEKALTNFVQEWIGSEDVRLNKSEWDRALAEARARFEDEESPNIPVRVKMSELFTIQPTEMEEVEVEFRYSLWVRSTRNSEEFLQVGILGDSSFYRFQCHSTAHDFECSFEL